MTILQIKQGPMCPKKLASLAVDDDEHDLILAVAKQLNVKTSDEMEAIRDILFPSILCAAVHTGNFFQKYFSKVHIPFFTD